MKKLIFISAIALFAMGCGSASGPVANTVSDAQPGPTRTPAPDVQPPSTGAMEMPVAPKLEKLADLRLANGATGKDIALWESKEVTGRLEKMLGADYAAMKKNWNAETPVVVHDNVVMLSGCQQKSCDANNYIIFADTASDNINVVHIKDGKSKKYSEKGEIALPQEFSELLVKLSGESK